MGSINIARKLNFEGAEKTFSEKTFLLTSYQGLHKSAINAIKEGNDDDSTDPNDYQIISPKGICEMGTNAVVSCWSMIDQTVDNPGHLLLLPCFKNKCSDPNNCAVILISTADYFLSFMNYKIEEMTDRSLTKLNSIIDRINKLPVEIIDNYLLSKISYLKTNKSSCWKVRHDLLDYSDEMQRQEITKSVHDKGPIWIHKVGFLKNKRFDFEVEYRFTATCSALDLIAWNIQNRLNEWIKRTQGLSAILKKDSEELIKDVLNLSQNVGDEFNSILIPWDMSCKPFQNVFINPNLAQDKKDILIKIIPSELLVT